MEFAGETELLGLRRGARQLRVGGILQHVSVARNRDLSVKLNRLPARAIDLSAIHNPIFSYTSILIGRAVANATTVV